MINVVVFAAFLVLAPLAARADLWPTIKESNALKAVREKTDVDIPDTLGETKAARDKLAASLENVWQGIEKKAKEEAGVDFFKLWRWSAGKLAALFSWLASLFSKYSG